MNDNLQAETELMFNQVVLDGGGILCRVIGYSEDKYDCYVTCLHMAPYGEQGKIIHHSYVGGVTSLCRLKGQGYVLAYNGEEWDDYYRLDQLLELNGAPKQKEFRLDIDHENVSAYGGYTGT
jgi:hypothetical protein